MESYPLMLLATLVYISVLLVVGETPLAVARRNEPFWSNPFSRFTRNNKNSQDPSAAEFRQPEFQSNNEEWDRFSEPFPADPPPRSRWGNRKKSPPPPSRNEGQPTSIADLVDGLFPGFKYTTTRPPKTKKSKYPAKEIHVEIDDVKDLSNIFNYEGYDDIVLSITQQDSPSPGPVKSNEQQHRPSINNNSKEKQSKPFWGPPISMPTPRPESFDPRPSAKQPPESFKPEEDFSVYHTSTVGNIWELTTPGPKVAAPPSEGHKNSINDILNEKPTESFWGPLHTPASPYDKEHELDPFDMNFWDRATATEATYYNNPTSPETSFQSKSSLHYPAPGAHHPQQTPSTPLHAKEIDSYGKHHSALVAYPPAVTKQEHHVVYHQPTSNHHHSTAPSGFAQVDFSPIFLALIPLALVLGAAASFALASAVTSNTAIATAQQQQQQQESSNSNNNNAANNNNANSILSLLASYYTSNTNNQPLIIVLTTEATTTTTTATTMGGGGGMMSSSSGRIGLEDEAVETTTPMMSYGGGGGYDGDYDELWRNKK